MKDLCCGYVSCSPGMSASSRETPIRSYPSPFSLFGASCLVNHFAQETIPDLGRFRELQNKNQQRDIFDLTTRCSRAIVPVR
jgi:hypothetical protein